MTRNTTTTGAKSTKFRTIMAALLVGGALISQVTQAAAVSPAVRVACLSDYLTNCSAHSVGSRLSKGCINALVASGEVSKAEVSRRSTASAN